MGISLKPLKEQVIALAGASSGIGLVTARMAAKQGAKLVVPARNEDALRQLNVGNPTAKWSALVFVGIAALALLAVPTNHNG